MMRHFTHLWSNDTVNNHKDIEGSVMEHTAGSVSGFSEIEEGDKIYLVSVVGGRLRALGTFTVVDVVSQMEAERVYAGHSLWEGEWHVRGEEGKPFELDRFVPMSIVTELRFYQKASGRQVPLLIKDGRVDGQTLRGLRQLTPASASLLDAIFAERIMHRQWR